MIVTEYNKVKFVNCASHHKDYGWVCDIGYIHDTLDGTNVFQERVSNINETVIENTIKRSFRASKNVGGNAVIEILFTGKAVHCQIGEIGVGSKPYKTLYCDDND